MTRIRTAHLPRHSSLWRHVAPGDFLHCRRIDSPFTVHEAARRATAMPVWARLLLQVSRVCAWPFGLHSLSGAHLVEQDCDNELVLGFDDRHLTCRIALLRDGGGLCVSTWVRPRTRFGRACLAGMMPLHAVLSRAALHRMAGHAVAPLPAWA